MPQGVTGRYTEAEDYKASLPNLMASLVVTQSGAFEALVTSVELSNVYLLRAEETLARAAYMAMPISRITVSFMSHAGPKLVLNGMDVPAGELVLHSPGECFHQRTTGATHWGTMSVKRAFFSRMGSALAGYDLEAPTSIRLVRPRPADMGCFLALHARVAAATQTKPATIMLPHVSRGLEDDLLLALVDCLTAGSASLPSRATLKRTATMGRLQTVIARGPDRLIAVSQLCAEFKVSERYLRACCLLTLGVGLSAYMRLRRLQRARAAIMQADSVTMRVETLARLFGFREMGRFAAAYRGAFGETPSATLRRAQSLSRRELCQATRKTHSRIASHSVLLALAVASDGSLAGACGLGEQQVARRIGMATRRELLEAVSARYRCGARAERSRILDEFAAVTSYHRRHAIRLLGARVAANLGAARSRGAG